MSREDCREETIEKLKSGPHKRDMIRWYKKRMRNERKKDH